MYVPIYICTSDLKDMNLYLQDIKSFSSRVERWSIFHGWNGAGCFSPAMEWRWFWKFLTITIDGFWWDQPLATMVFQWFFPILGTNGSRWLQTEICDKKSAQLKMKTEMQAKDLFHRKSLIVLISLEIVLSTIYFV